MTDKALIDLFLKREQKAIAETRKVYGNYIFKISYNILNSMEDAEENENTVLYSLWNSIPPAMPKNLKAFLAKIARNHAIDKYRKINADKRLGDKYAETLDELSEVIADESNVEDEVDLNILKSQINIFLDEISKKDRQIFISRYFYFDSIKEISNNMEITQSNVKVSLHRTREKLKDFLEKEGYEI